MIPDFVKKYVPEDEILLILGNYDDAKSHSSDIDVYCITKNISSVHLFSHNDVWTEVFVDSLADVRNKYKNIDEIAINFIRQLQFIYGDQRLHEKLKAEAKNIIKDYKLPEYRRNVLKYRVKVLLSKYLNPIQPPSEAQQQFVLNAISYPLIQLVMEYHGIFPSSPKQWLEQLKASLDEEEHETICALIGHKASREQVVYLAEKYASNLKSMDLDKSKENGTTFIS